MMVHTEKSVGVKEILSFMFRSLEMLKPLTPIIMLKQLLQTSSVLDGSFLAMGLPKIEYKTLKKIASEHPKEFAEYACSYTIEGFHRWLKTMENINPA